MTSQPNANQSTLSPEQVLCITARYIDRYENIKLAINIYSTNDMILDKILRQRPSLDPIDTTEILSEKNIAVNVKTNLSHSGYKDGAVTSTYRDFTKPVKKHCQEDT
jgi:hypothetical protein